MLFSKIRLTNEDVSLMQYFIFVLNNLKIDDIKSSENKLLPY